MSDPTTEQPDFRLDSVEMHSPVWLKLAKYMEAKLEQLRRENDNDADPIKTAKLRGRIASLKNLLALANPDPAKVADAEEGE